MKTKIKYTAAIALVLLLVFASMALAQGGLPIRAEVDRQQLSTDETLMLTVTIDAPLMSVPRPSMPDLQGFAVLGTSSSSRISIVNGATSSQVVYSYRLRPVEAGDMVIGPVQVALDGQTFSSEPISVRVTQRTAAASAPAAANQPPAVTSYQLNGQDVYVEAVVDKPTPFVGEQVVYSFRFYRAVNLSGQPQYEGPSFTGFWNEHQADQFDYRVQAAGRVYEVTELQTILFPTAAGPVSIDPARLTTAGSIFRSGATLQTRPVQVDVQPLPPDAPAGFAGAVGQYSLIAALDATQGVVDEPLTWEVMLKGIGNIAAAPDPKWPDLTNWRQFESEATVNSQALDGRVTGSREYERLLVPGASGEFTIPALEYVYFDPEAGGYQVASTVPVPVTIQPGANQASAVQPHTPAQVAVDTVATDIRHLKPVPSQLESADQPVTKQGIYWAAWGFPVLAAAAYTIWQRRQRFLESNLGVAKSSQARRKASKALAHARRQGGDAYSAAGLILTTYLSDKLDRPVGGLTHQALAELLARHGVAGELIERVEMCLVSSELGRFAPEASNPDHAGYLLKDVDRLIGALEKVL